MPTNAQLATQMADALTRWNTELDQLADWLNGDPAGGPNSDGKYPLTNAEQETELFLCLPALIDTVNGPAAAVSEDRDWVEHRAQQIYTLSQLIETMRDAAEGHKVTALEQADRAEVLRDETAAFWAAVSAKATQVATDTQSALDALTDALAAKTDAIEAKDAAVVARNEAEAFSITAQTFDPADYIPVLQKAAPSGVATLDIAGKIVPSQLPALVTVETFVEADETGHLTAPAEQGDVVVRTDLLQSFIHNGGTSGTMSDWQQLLSPTSDVQSVDGRVGVVSLSDLYAPFTHSHADYHVKGTAIQIDSNTGGSWSNNTIGWLSDSIVVNAKTGYNGYLASGGTPVATWKAGDGFNVVNGPLKQGGVQVSLEGHTHTDYVSKSSTLQTTLNSNVIIAGTNPFLHIKGDGVSYYPSLKIGDYSDASRLVIGAYRGGQWKSDSGIQVVEQDNTEILLVTPTSFKYAGTDVSIDGHNHVKTQKVLNANYDLDDDDFDKLIVHYGGTEYEVTLTASLTGFPIGASVTFACLSPTPFRLLRNSQALIVDRAPHYGDIRLNRWDVAVLTKLNANTWKITGEFDAL